jgi:hypothetical protein
MKILTKKNAIIVGIGFPLFICNTLNAQFVIIPGTSNQYYRANNTVSGIGLGNSFSAASPPQSAFHINTNQLPFPAAFTPGEVCIVLKKVYTFLAKSYNNFTL